ncbi:MAG: hypothetical protein AAGJ18_14210 [Bacteroidota bacterium]
MKQTFTNNDLVKFIYKETSAVETLAIQEALLMDAVLFDSYQSLMEGYSELPKVTFAPTNNALQNILKYSATNCVEA